MAQATRYGHLNFSDYVERALREGAMWSLMCVALYLLVALLSYSPDDPGWSHVGETARVHNVGGRAGAWFADVTLYLFGFFAYLLPAMIGASAWLIFRRHSPAAVKSAGQPRAWILSLRWLGFLLTLAAGSGFAAMHLDVPAAQLTNGTGGGLGLLVSGTMIAAFNPIGTDLLLTGVLLAGLTLLLGVSWMGLIDRLGAVLRQGAFAGWTVLTDLGARLSFARIAAPASGAAAGLPEALNLLDPAEAAPAPPKAGRARARRLPDKLPPGVRDALIDPPRGRIEPRLGVAGRPEVDPWSAPESVSVAGPLEPAPEMLVSLDKFLGARPAAPAAARSTPVPARTAPESARRESESRSAPPARPPEPRPATPGARTMTAAAPPTPPTPPARPEAVPRPPLELLDAPRPSGRAYTAVQIEELSRQVEARLADFGVDVRVVAVYPGPVVTLFELDLAPGIKASKITGLARDLARALSTVSVRVVEIIPGKSVIGIEIPNKQRETVFLRQIFGSEPYREARSPLSLGLGTDISGQPVVADLGRMPHVLIAGTTGSGKSVAINAMILSLLYKAGPEDVRLIMVDPKMLELSVYEGIPHLLTPVVTDMKEAANALRWCVGEMERRYRLMSKLGVRNIAGYNRQVAEAIEAGTPILDPTLTAEQAAQRGLEIPTLGHLPYIVVIIDELADMMMVVGKKVEELIARLAQKARASGIHLLLATQRPSVDVLTGLIKANIPTRIAFQVSSRIDSRTVLDQMGAEQLLGHGDMLYLPPGGNIPQRVHGAFVDDHEVHKIVEFLKQFGAPDYIEDVLREPGETLPGIDPEPRGGGGDLEDNDPLFDEAVKIVLESRRASISGVQRRLKIGYNRAARMIEEMERIGLVGPAETNGNREVLAPAPVADD